MSTKKKGYVFEASISKGYFFKVAIDAIAQVMDRTTLVLTKDGIYHTNVDDKNTVLIDLELPREAFTSYSCRDRMVFSVSARCMNTAMKNIKKKNPMKLYISEKNPMKLRIMILPPQSTDVCHDKEENSVNISELVDNDNGVEPPKFTQDEEGNDVPIYKYSKMLKAGDFQKVRGNWTGSKNIITRTIRVKIQGSSFISFKSNTGVTSSNMKFGQVIKDDPNFDEDERRIYTADFTKELFSSIAKVQALGENLHFYAPNDRSYPLKVECIGENGKVIVVYIKDKQQIALESADKDREISIGDEETETPQKKPKKSPSKTTKKQVARKAVKKSPAKTAKKQAPTKRAARATKKKPRGKK